MIRNHFQRFFSFINRIPFGMLIGAMLLIYVFAAPTKAKVYSTHTTDTSLVICGNFLDVSTTGITAKFNTGNWKTIEGSGVILNGNTFYAFFSNLNQQKNTFVWKSSNGEEQITLTVYNHQSKAIIFKNPVIERNKIFCTTTLNLAAENPEKNLIGAKGWWVATKVPAENVGNINFSNQSQVISRNKDTVSTFAYNINAAGAYTFKWVVKHPDCKADTAEWAIVNRRNIAKITTSDVENKPTCGLPVVLAVQKLATTSNGEWKVNKVPSLGTPAPLRSLLNQTSTTQNWTISNFTMPGSYDLSWVVSSKNTQECASDSQSISVLNIKPLAELDYTNPIVDVCGSVVLKAKNPSLAGAGLTGKWILERKPINAAAINTENLKFNSTVNFNKPGNYYFKWVVHKDNPVCNSDTASIIFSNIKPSIVNAGRDSTVCSNIYDLKATDKNIESLPNTKGLWSIYSKTAQTDTILFDDSTRSTAIVRNLKNIGSYGFLWTVSTSTNTIAYCASSDSVLITNHLHPEFLVSNTQKFFCDTLKLLPPTKVFPKGTIVPVETWKVSENNNPESSIILFSQADNITRSTGFLRPGSYKFDYTFNYNGCETKTIVTSQNLKPSLFVIDNKGQNFCGDSIRLSAPLVESGFKGEWKNISMATMPVPIFSNNSLTNTYVKGFDKPGIYQFQWVVSSTGSLQCSRSSEIVTYTNEKAAALAASYKTDTNFCGNILKLINPPIEAGFTYNNSSWTLLPTASTDISKAVKSDTTIFSNILTNGKLMIVWFMANSTNPSCQRFDTIFRINQQPNMVNSAGSDMEVCGQSNVVTMNGKMNAAMPMIKGKWRLIEKPAGAKDLNFIGDSANINLKLAGFNRSGIYRFSWPLKNLGCTEVDEVLVTNKASDTIFAKSLLKFTCYSFDSLIGYNAKGQPAMKDAKYNWRIIDQPPPTREAPIGANITDTTLPATKISMSNYGIFKIVYSIQNSNCIVSDTVTISRSQKFPASVPQTTYFTCEDSLIIWSNPADVPGRWDISRGSQQQPIPLNEDKTKVLVTGFSEAEINEYSWIIQPPNCQPNTVTISVKKYPKLKKIAFSQPVIRICEQDTILLRPPARTDLTMIPEWWWTETPSSINPYTKKDNYFYHYIPYGKSQLFFRWVEPNGSCKSNFDTITIYRDSAFQNKVNYAKILCDSVVKISTTNVNKATYQWKANSNNPSVIDPQNLTIIDTILRNPSTPKTIWFNSLTKPGLYSISLEISRGACVFKETIVTERKANPSAAIIMTSKFIKDTICEQEEPKVFVAKQPDSGTKGYWLINKTKNIQDTTTIKVTLDKGKTNTIEWITTVGNYCQSRAGDSVFVAAKPPRANAGIDKIVYSPTSKLDATIPVLNVGDRAQWLLAPNNLATIANTNEAKSEISNLMAGQNIFYWKIFNSGCPAVIDTLVITRLQSEIPKAFSPNNDQKNETFYIMGIEEYEFTTLEVFNRWGDLVYANNDYKNEWAGESKDGKPLPDDTYYYVLNLGKNNTIKNFVIIKR